MTFHDVTFVTGAATFDQLPAPSLPEVAFVGRSNVGKSSLVNRVLGRRSVARTSGTPGKTREINFFRVDDRFLLVDLPGFGYARVSRSERERWQRLIGRYVLERPSLRVVFQLIDSRHDPTALDRELMVLMRESPAEHVVLLTKADKLSGNERARSISRTKKALEAAGLEKPVVLTSAVDGRGRDQILEWMDLYI